LGAVDVALHLVHQRHKEGAEILALRMLVNGRVDRLFLVAVVSVVRIRPESP